jgi:hypothetical protein
VTTVVVPPSAPATADQARAVREALNQAADLAVNRLGRPDGFWGNPRVRIPLPDELQRVEKNLRRLGLERHAEEFAETLNRAAEEAMPAAKPVLLEAVRNLTLADAVAIVRGDEQAATRYFRTHTESPLQQRLLPVIATATARVGVTASYKRLVRKAVFLDKLVDPARLDLDAHVTRAALDGLYRMMAEEEQRIRRDPRARTTELLRQVFR